jgi:hypothetical protein
MEVVCLVRAGNRKLREKRDEMIYLVVVHATVRSPLVLVEGHVFEHQATVLTGEAVGVPAGVEGVDDSSGDQLLAPGAGKRRVIRRSLWTIMIMIMVVMTHWRF